MNKLSLLTLLLTSLVACGTPDDTSVDPKVEAERELKCKVASTVVLKDWEGEYWQKDKVGIVKAFSTQDNSDMLSIVFGSILEKKTYDFAKERDFRLNLLANVKADGDSDKLYRPYQGTIAVTESSSKGFKAVLSGIILKEHSERDFVKDGCEVRIEDVTVDLSKFKKGTEEDGGDEEL